ncbi:hypothetical protein CSOJ01_05882 [Colletotrichum sojae]|uniref:Uncharacterized protein n=1 Tax=Colletotrichum sojae TaxID=2175907 RepID=A0A8H6MWV1_9PEZI|nr:hypothetical protein CSOJ01_05882 [Colletotrichum sojae]
MNGSCWFLGTWRSKGGIPFWGFGLYRKCSRRERCSRGSDSTLELSDPVARSHQGAMQYTIRSSQVRSF